MRKKFQWIKNKIMIKFFQEFLIITIFQKMVKKKVQLQKIKAIKNQIIKTHLKN